MNRMKMVLLTLATAAIAFAGDVDSGKECNKPKECKTQTTCCKSKEDCKKGETVTKKECHGETAATESATSKSCDKSKGEKKCNSGKKSCPKS